MRKKRFSILGLAALSVVAMTSAVSAAPATSSDALDRVIYEKDNLPYAIGYGDYNDVVSSGLKLEGKIGYVSSDSKIFSVDDFNEAIAATGTAGKAIKLLKDTPGTVQNIVPGTIEITANGQISYVKAEDNSKPGDDEASDLEVVEIN